jgi:ABC-2 type transport system ATP-binding protein
VRVRTNDLGRLAALVAGDGVTVNREPDGSATLSGVTPERIGDSAAAAGLPIYELTVVSGSLEDAYLTLTADEVEYRSTAAEEIAR